MDRTLKRNYGQDPDNKTATVEQKLTTRTKMRKLMTRTKMRTQIVITTISITIISTNIIIIIIRHQTLDTIHPLLNMTRNMTMTVTNNIATELCNRDQILVREPHPHHAQTHVQLLTTSIVVITIRITKY